MSRAVPVAIRLYWGAGRRISSPGSDTFQPCDAPLMKRLRTPFWVTKMSPSMSIASTAETSWALASRPVEEAGKLPSRAGV